MNKQLESVEQYLEQVENYLEPLADKDQIIKELRAHIWDQANRISQEKGLPVQDAFDEAILMMEDPKTLADKFLEEEPSSDFAADWKAPIKVPESKVQNEQFLVLAIIGFAAVIIMALAIQIISNDFLVSILAVIIGILAIGMFTFGLYHSDERLFQEQLDRFREMFQKPKSSQKAMEASSVSFIQEKPVTKEVGFWSAFGEHLGGFLGGIFIAFLIAFIFLLEQLPLFNLPLFNENWYYIGALATYGALGAGLAYSAFLVVFGRIRVTRLASATRNIIGFCCAVILVWYYPFTLELAILAQNITWVMGDPDLLLLVSKSDLFLRLIIGISGIISGISALYDVFKFGAWQPSDRKSLI
jgi:hypothetical protein